VEAQNSTCVGYLSGIAITRITGDAYIVGPIAYLMGCNAPPRVFPRQFTVVVRSSKRCYNLGLPGDNDIPSGGTMSRIVCTRQTDRDRTKSRTPLMACLSGTSRLVARSFEGFKGIVHLLKERLLYHIEEHNQSEFIYYVDATNKYANVGRHFEQVTAILRLPSGKLVQIEYALSRVNKGDTSLAVKAKNGVVLATEKKLATLVDETSVDKISLIANNIAVTYSGMAPDSRVLIRKGRKKAQAYFRMYKDRIPVAQLVKDLASIMQEFTQSGGVRPFGVSLLIAGYDDQGPQLYQVDPSGSYWAWKASAIGRNMLNAKTFLEKRYNEDIELEDAIHTAILTLKEGFEGEMNENNIEIGIIGEDQKFRVLTPAQIKDYLGELE
ncbi:hypothetical protein PROFUN_07159, partial [Planoprotostelium fungivorum]